MNIEISSYALVVAPGKARELRLKAAIRALSTTKLECLTPSPIKGEYEFIYSGVKLIGHFDEYLDKFLIEQVNFITTPVTRNLLEREQIKKLN